MDREKERETGGERRPTQTPREATGRQRGTHGREQGQVDRRSDGQETQKREEIWIEGRETVTGRQVYRGQDREHDRHGSRVVGSETDRFSERQWEWETDGRRRLGDTGGRKGQVEVKIGT